MPPILQVDHLGVAFGERRVLEDVSFSVDAGTVLTIIGPNGSGKTVLFKALIGAVPASGTVRWALDTRIGYVPQKLDIDRDLPLTGVEFLLAKAQVTGAPATEAARVVDLVGLGADVASHPIGTLSGGQFQRLLLAYAFIGHPNVLLFDEPTAGVDEVGEQGIFAILRRMQQMEGLTILLISHELSLVYRHADSVLCLTRRRSFLGPPTEMLTPERLRELYGAPMGFHEHAHA